MTRAGSALPPEQHRTLDDLFAPLKRSGEVLVAPAAKRVRHETRGYEAQMRQAEAGVAEGSGGARIHEMGMGMDGGVAVDTDWPTCVLGEGCDEGRGVAMRHCRDVACGRGMGSAPGSLAPALITDTLLSPPPLSPLSRSGVQWRPR